MPTSRSDSSFVPPAEPSPKGRPNAQRAHQIRQLIIEVAAEVMLQQGFCGTSLDAIASAAGVTKRTIYDRFGSKEALLREALLNTARPARNTFEAPTASTCLRERLVAITMGLHERWMAPRMQRWMRLAACEFIQLPDKVPVLQGAMDDLHAFVEEVLRSELGGQGRSIDSLTAKAFTFMIAAPPQAQALLGIAVGSPEQQQLYVERAVDMLLASVAPNEPFANDA